MRVRRYGPSCVVILRLWKASVACLLLGAGASSLRAGFSPPRLVTESSGNATQTATGIDLSNDAYIASVVDEKIQLRIIGPDLDVTKSIDTGAIAQGDPDFATNVRFDTYLCFSQVDEKAPFEGREIYLTKLVGGQLGQAVNISRNRVEDFAPRIALDSQGAPHVVWAQSVTLADGQGHLKTETRVMYWSESVPGGEPAFVAIGNYPAIFLDESGMAHLVYSRDNDVWYNNNTGGRYNSERQVTTTPSEPESPPSIGVDPAGNVLICFESKNSLYWSTKSSGSSFRPPKLVDRGGVLDPKMRVRREGQVDIVYAKGTDIYWVKGQSSFLNASQKLELDNSQAESGPKSRPSLEVDLASNLHLSYIQNRRVYYTNNASAPTAEFSADPTQGEVPLTVRFGDLSNGEIQVWQWDFGDGGTASVPSPTYTYVTPGKYSVKLTVKAPGATESSIVKEDFIFVENPFNTLRIPDQTVFPGQQEIWFPVIASHREPIDGFQLLGTYDPNYIILRDFRHDGFRFDFTTVAALNPNPEIFVANACQEGVEDQDEGCVGSTQTFFEVGCIFDFNPPIDHQTLPAGQNQTLLQLIFDLSDEAPEGGETQVALVNNPNLSRVHFNIFIINGFSQYPALTSSTVKIRTVQPPFPRFFLRGDADGNKKLDITDAIKILNFLFLGATPPPCLDAADFSDSGKVDISSAVGLLNYLYQGGSPPSVPFPREGLDPSQDTLGDC